MPANRVVFGAVQHFVKLFVQVLVLVASQPIEQYEEKLTHREGSPARTKMLERVQLCVY